ncbi:MAG: FemAB family PEP-CTERM system-associated protein [Desulfobacterales bacterium]|nr:FemAB family PEP-CTERM system-associated protein [Desulfobacterales bacterium]
MQIELYKRSDRAAWDDYVSRHPKGTFFHLSGWKEVVEESFGHKSYYLLAVSSPVHTDPRTLSPEPQIVGVFPLFSIKSRLFGRSMVSLPFATYGGILADNDQVENALYKEAVSLTKTNALDYLEIRSEEARLGDLPVKDLYYAFKREISGDNEENLTAIPRKTRRMVRKAMKNELYAAFGGVELLDQFYKLFAFSYHVFGTPVFSKKYLKNLLDTFKSNSSILVISKNGSPLSGVLSFYFKDQVIPYYSGAYPDSREHAANDYLYWVLMSDAAEKGCRAFDFGRSKKDTGPYHFKRHWGFEPRPLPYQYYLNNIEELPNISPTNPKYKRRIKLWKKLPLWATKIIGPRIVKYIP